MAAAIAREASDACILTGFQNGHETITNSHHQTISIDTTGMIAGVYEVTITGRLLTQSISFLVVPQIG